MDKDNKKRLMLMKEVLEKYSDEDHPVTTVQIMEILEKEYGMKVHRTTVARDVADQIIFMDNGVIVEQGDPHEVIDHPKEERTRQFLAHYAEQ